MYERVLVLKILKDFEIRKKKKGEKKEKKHWAKILRIWLRNVPQKNLGQAMQETKGVMTLTLLHHSRLMLARRGSSHVND